MANEPIEPQNYVHGVNVVDIGEARISRGLSKRTLSAFACRHLSMVYDSQERRIWCEDCEHDVDGFDAFTAVVEWHKSAWEQIKRAKKEVSEAVGFNIRSIAARIMDKEWRKRNTVPCCPHCSRGLLPEDFRNGPRRHVSKELEIERRKQE